LTNNTTSESITLNYAMLLNELLIVDCNAKTITYGDGAGDGANAFSAIELSTNRQDWLSLAAGANTLQFDDVNTGNITITTTYRSRAL
jgi:phage-related protein